MTRFRLGNPLSLVGLVASLVACSSAAVSKSPYWEDPIWQKALVQSVADHMTYPNNGWKEGFPSGTGTVGFTYEHGLLTGAHIVKSTGSLILDKALLTGIQATQPPAVTPAYVSQKHDFELAFDLNPSAEDFQDDLDDFVATGVKYPDDRYPSQAAIMYVDGVYLDGKWKSIGIRIRQGGTEDTSKVLLDALNSMQLPTVPPALKGTVFPLQLRYCISTDYQFCLLNTFKNFGDFHGVSITISPWKNSSADFNQTMTKAKAGDADAQAHLGTLYEEGTGAPVDFEQAVYWYRKAALQGDEVAQDKLNHVYARGLGVPLSQSGPIGYLTDQANKGAIDAQAFLGWWYVWSSDITPDYAQGASWLKKAAEQGYGRAVDNLGLLYHTGRGVPKDMAQAIALLKKAAADGYYSANGTLGYFYEAGVGVAKDDAIAADWYRKATPQDSNAECNLLRLNVKGEVQPISAEENTRWQKLLKSDMECVNDIAWTLATAPDPSRRDPSKAVELAKIAVSKQDNDWRSLDTLAAAQAAAGNFKDAVRTEQDAIDTLTKLNRGSTGLPPARARLALYQTGQIYTEGD